MVRTGVPHGVSRGISLILGHGRASADDPETPQQMRDKYPHGRGAFTPHAPDANGLDLPNLSRARNLVKKIDPMVGTGPRGFHGGHLLALQIPEPNFENSARGTPLDSFQALGEAVFFGDIPWVVAALGECLFTPLKK